MTQENTDKKYRKNILLLFENKRNIQLSKLEDVVESFAACGYFFDKISRVSFSESGEIVRAVNDGLDNYENIILFCPARMGKTLTDYVVSVIGGEFDNFGVLTKGSSNVFLVYSDRDSRLQLTDVKSILDKKYNTRYEKTVIRAVGVPAKILDESLAVAKVIFGDSGVAFNVTEKFDDCKIEVVYSAQTPKMTLDDGVREILKSLNGYIYAMEDIPLAEQLYRLLKLRRMKISVAESFTGGGVGKRLVDVPGVSEVFYEGINTYSNGSKMERLGVSELTLNQRGAVSAETAFQMAEGLIKSGNCDVAISTTGIAGPKSDNTSKPVGLAYIGLGVGEDIAVYKYNFVGDRETITQTAINHALFLAYKRLK